LIGVTGEESVTWLIRVAGPENLLILGILQIPRLPADRAARRRPTKRGALGESNVSSESFV